MQDLKAASGIIDDAAKAAKAILMAGAMIAIASGQSMANPAIAKKTGEACTKCHAAPPALNDYGKKYKDSQNK